MPPPRVAGRGTLGARHIGDRIQLAQDFYRAFAAGDRDAVEAILTDDFSFSSPPDVGLDRAGFFDRCWPGSGRGQRFEFVRLIEAGDELVVTYHRTKPDGTVGRNTEVLTFRGDRVSGAEVYFGWDVQ